MGTPHTRPSNQFTKLVKASMEFSPSLNYFSFRFMRLPKLGESEKKRGKKTHASVGIRNIREIHSTDKSAFCQPAVGPP